MNRAVYRKSVVVLVILMLFTAFVVSASHSWGNYHWARSSNPVNLTVGDNVSANWQSYFDVAVSDWNASSVLNLTAAPNLFFPNSDRYTPPQTPTGNAHRQESPTKMKLPTMALLMPPPGSPTLPLLRPRAASPAPFSDHRPQ